LTEKNLFAFLANFLLDKMDLTLYVLIIGKDRLSSKDFGSIAEVIEVGGILAARIVSEGRGLALLINHQKV